MVDLKSAIIVNQVLGTIKIYDFKGELIFEGTIPQAYALRRSLTVGLEGLDE